MRETYTDESHSCIRPNEGTTYERQQALGITMSSYSKNEGYYEFQSYSGERWLRSSYTGTSYFAHTVRHTGEYSTEDPYREYGVSPGFCLK